MVEGGPYKAVMAVQLRPGRPLTKKAPGDAMSNVKTKLVIGWDKLWHFSGCCLLSLIATLIIHNPIRAFAMISFLGLAKEVFDYHDSEHQCEVWDLIADVLGAGLGAFMASYFI